MADHMHWRRFDWSFDSISRLNVSQRLPMLQRKKSWPNMSGTTSAAIGVPGGVSLRSLLS